MAGPRWRAAWTLRRTESVAEALSPTGTGFATPSPNRDPRYPCRLVGQRARDAAAAHGTGRDSPGATAPQIARAHSTGVGLPSPDGIDALVVQALARRELVLIAH